jgi:DNA-binding GntR family transcriptional regulator
VYDQIKHDILNNTYPPGTVMVERKLCEIYNVSRSPIRNALQKLSHEGLLSFAPGKGVIVPEFTIEDIFEVYDLIELIQVFAVSRCIANSNDIVSGTLKDILEKMKAAQDEDNIALASEWDQRFHFCIINFAGNKRLSAFFKSLNDQSMRFQATTLQNRELAQRSLGEHMEIYQAVAQGDSKKAKEAIMKHYYNIKQYYLSVIIMH